MGTMTTERPRYLAYMLRLWRVDMNGEAVWRASIEDPHTGERHGFANLDRLFEFLERQTRELDQSVNRVINSVNDTGAGPLN